MNKKQSAFLIGGLLMVGVMQSCIKHSGLYEEKKPVYSELSISLGGELVVTEQPMVKSGEDDHSKEIYGINVAMLIKDQNGNTTQQPYAYGIFDYASVQDSKKLKLNVIDGYQYRISCTMIKEAKDSLLTGDSYLVPFNISRDGKNGGKITNKFVTVDQADGQYYLYNLDNSKIQTITGTQNAYNHPFIRRYHGLVDKLTVVEGQNTELNVYRRYFGVKFEQKGLREGELKVVLKDAPGIFLTKEKPQSAEYMVSMGNMTAQVDASRVMTENIIMDVYLCKDGKEEKLISTTRTFKRNYMHKIVITDIDHMGTPSNLKILVEEEEMKDDYQQDIPWQGDN